jgi:2-polyprenyl-6-methoxyphenol hydroxylase-like FAD-dependent oxidoreductase
MTQDHLSNTATDAGPLKRHCDVVIVGAGVVGLYTALLLKKQGINVQVYERQPAMYALPKAISLSDESLRSFHLNGFGDLVDNHIVNAGIQSDNAHFTWTDGDLSECAAPLLLLLKWCGSDACFPNTDVLSKFRNRAAGSSGYSAMSVSHQPNVEAYLNLQCEAHLIPLYRRWNYRESEQRTDGDLVIHFDRHAPTSAGKQQIHQVYNHQVDVTCKWLIGCDGANSKVREKAGLKQQDLAFKYDWLVVDVFPNPEVPLTRTWTQVCNPKRPTTMIGEGINGRRRFEFMRLESESVQELSSPEATWKLLEPFHMNSSNTEIERAAVYQFQALK